MKKTISKKEFKKIAFNKNNRYYLEDFILLQTGLTYFSVAVVSEDRKNNFTFLLEKRDVFNLQCAILEIFYNGIEQVFSGEDVGYNDFLEKDKNFTNFRNKAFKKIKKELKDPGYYGASIILNNPEKEDSKIIYVDDNGEIESTYI